MQRQPKARGVLTGAAADKPFSLQLLPPQAELVDIVEHYWYVGWDLRGHDAFEQHTLPHPSVHLVAERDRSAIFGVLPGRFTRILEGQGWAFGVKFRPAGFRPFLGSRVSALTRRIVPVSDVLGQAGDELMSAILALDDEARMADLAGAFLRQRLSHTDPSVPIVNGIVAQIVADRSITRVADVVDRTGLGERRLQRLFGDYVGIGPKWVIQRSRLIEAAERLAVGESIDSAALAQDLGYFDQAHFIRDFGRVVGRPPFEYARGVSSSP